MSLQPYSAPGSTSSAQPQNKRKNILTGHAEEIAVSDITFKTQHRKYLQRNARPDAPASAKRQKGQASIVSGENAYKGPWAKFEGEDEQYSEEEASLASDEEYEEESTVAPGPSATAPMPKASTAYAADDPNSETTQFHGSQEFDYQGRSYMHVPQDLDIDLRAESGSTRNYIPSKQIHSWKTSSKAITSLRFFPGSGHLLLSASADSKISLYDVYHERELLRTYSGHNKSITGTDFDSDGMSFLSASFDRQMKLWDTETGQCKARFTTGKIPHVVKFNPSSPNDFLAGMSDNKIVQFDIRTPGEKTQEYDHHLGPVNSITFVDEDRRFITTSDDKSLRAWEFGIPVPIKFIAEPHMYSLIRAAPHPSGKYVLFQSLDNSIPVYASTDRFRQNRKKQFRGHNNAGYAIDLCVSPDGQFVCSGDSGGYLVFWDWKSCKMYHKIFAGEKGKSAPITCVAWHPRESSKVVSAGLDGAVKYWD